MERLRDFARDYTTMTYHEDLVMEGAAAIEALEECESVLRRVGCDVTADIARAALAAKEADGE